jgi:DNA-binding NarL/FixJ family response regulator
MDQLKVIVVDDQQLICDGIRVILNSQPDMEVVATANDGHTAVEYADVHQPDVVLLDIEMPGMSGIETLKAIKARKPEITILMLTTFAVDDYIFGAFRNGATGYLLKDLSGDRLAAAIRDARVGHCTIPSAIAARLIAPIPADRQQRTLADYQLSQREADVAELIVQGCPNEKIARTLGISLGTTKNYISTLYSKLEVDNRQEAIRIMVGLTGNKAK